MTLCVKGGTSAHTTNMLEDESVCVCVCVEGAVIGHDGVLRVPLTLRPFVVCVCACMCVCVCVCVFLDARVCLCVCEFCVY